ncbi:MAG: SocA family protein [Deltaproteobacteria bacterium]|nr:SocA family protein [Deltaproteobacteria bacterium]MBF0526209.1 SocA family protein [Deltaproteobacteria bacterium]
MSVTTANAVADYILCHPDRPNDLSNLKMQKLVYYAQAWFLALYDEPLFDDRFEAWIHGPVQPELYQRFKKYKGGAIAETPDCPVFPDESVYEHLDELIRVYGHLSAYELEWSVHSEDPWKNARKGLQIDESCRNAIDHEDMKVFYRNDVADQEN